MTDNGRKTGVEEPTNSTGRLLFLLGVSLVGLVVVIVWFAVAGGNGDTNDQSQSPGQTSTTATPASDQLDGAAGRGAPNAGSGPGDEPENSADSVDELSSEACNQFEQGGTVAEFAEWFEDQFQDSDSERADIFRMVITQALEEDCPEVVPDS